MNCFEGEIIPKQSCNTSKKWEICLEISGLSSFNIWTPWKNEQEAFMAIDRFIRDAKQQALVHFKYNFNRNNNKALEGKVGS